MLPIKRVSNSWYEAIYGETVQNHSERVFMKYIFLLASCVLSIQMNPPSSNNGQFPKLCFPLKEYQTPGMKQFMVKLSKILQREISCNMSSMLAS